MNVPTDRVMIIEDDRRNQLVALESLEGLSLLKAVSTGEEALECIDEFSPNLVLLDVAMPGLSGYDVCKIIRAKPNLRFTKIVLISGKSTTEEKIKGYALGADDYVTKPFIPSELHAKAKVFLRLSRIEKELDELNQALDKKVQEKTRELYETQTKLMNAAKMAALGEMAGGVAHEINNPLATIGILGEQIKKLLEIDADAWKPKVTEMAGTIVVSVKHIADIVNDLRTFSSGGEQDSFKESSLTQIIKSTLHLCNERCKARRIDLQVDMADDIIVYCRPVQISQVLMNLISNSYDALVGFDLPEKWIRVSVQNRPDHVVILVADSGPGIPEAIRDKIFQPLFTTKEIGKGTGLGLSVSKGIMGSHLGSLTLNTTSLYTEFALILPKNAPQLKE